MILTESKIFLLLLKLILEIRIDFGDPKSIGCPNGHPNTLEMGFIVPIIKRVHLLFQTATRTVVNLEY